MGRRARGLAKQGFFAIGLEGDVELIKVLDSLPDGISRRVIAGAAKAAMSPVNKAAKGTLRGPRARRRHGKRWRPSGR